MLLVCINISTPLVTSDSVERPTLLLVHGDAEEESAGPSEPPIKLGP